MKKYVNGEYVELTQEEVDAIKARNQKELLENASKYELTRDDILMVLAQSVNITLPTGESKPAAEIMNTEVELPIKVGYKWELHGTLFTLVPDPEAVGTSNNPIICRWDSARMSIASPIPTIDEVPKIENAFYSIDGITHVYMGGEFVEF